MLKYRFMGESNCSKEDALQLLGDTDKEILYTYGLKYRSPNVCNVPITKERAIELFKSKSLCDLSEHEDYIDLNAYHENDLF